MLKALRIKEAKGDVIKLTDVIGGATPHSSTVFSEWREN